MSSALSHLLRPGADTQQKVYVACEGFATYPITPLHLRELPPAGTLYFGGGLADDAISAACGATVNWDDHVYDEVEISYAVPNQRALLQFCDACLGALALD